ncbi:prothoracicotropic hormone [Musca autumnalis]|uniref:prothoracicotropic hormone n=1 Tax=Musca autumnalis TaxID=221902 RepID=UPI003CF6F8F7
MDKHLMRSISGHTSSSSSSSPADSGFYDHSRQPYKPPTSSNRNDFLDFIPKFKDESLGKPPPQYQATKSSCQDQQWLDFLKPEQDFVNCDDNGNLDEMTYSDGYFKGNLNIFKEMPFKPQGRNIFDEDNVVNGGDDDDVGGGMAPFDLLAPKLSALPVANFKDFYNDLVADSNKEMDIKRNGNAIGTPLGTPPARGCDCKVKNDLVDLGQQHFPRYLLNAVCQTDEMAAKCWSGSICRPLEYKVKVLTFRTLMDNMQKDLTLAWLPDDLRQIWKFKTVTVTAGCFCS